MLSSGLSLNENQTLLEQSLGRYLRESYDMPERTRIINSEQGFSPEHWLFFAEMGLLALPFPESDGGLDGSLADVMLVMRLFGGALVVEPYHESVIMAGRLVGHSASTDQRSRWLAPLICGEKMLALAHRERAGRQHHGAIQATLRSEGRELLLTADKCLVPLPCGVDTLLVTARDHADEVVVCAVSPDAAGVTVRPYRGIDGRRYGDVKIDRVEVTADCVLALDDAAAALDEVIAFGEACLCSEAIGIMVALQTMTVEYAQTRKQFGVAIGSFQALKHRMVDCYTSLYQATALVELLGAGFSPEWRKYLAAASSFVRTQGVRIGHEAIQIHGGMGVTDELAVSHYHKRLSAISLLLGTGQFTANSIAQSAGFFRHGAGEVVPPFENYLDDKAKVFRSEVRDFVVGNLTDEIRQAVRRQVNAFTEPETTGAWLERLATRSWQAPHWPKELGGTGWSPLERFVYDYETGLLDVPELAPMGFRYVGPVIAHFGSDWQKAWFLPKILSGEHYWAQGFSEPQAGSDLAALKTTAVREGDHFVLNGSKMWTTHAHHANWLFCLARTDRDARPQQGIGFFLVELKSPGIRIDAIPLMTGPREVNQVFLDNVRVPATHLVGELTQGWEYTKFLLEFERGGAVFCGRARSELNRAKELITQIRNDLAENSLFLDRLGDLETRLIALELLEYRHSAALQAGGPPGIGGSITKLLASELRKDISELTMQMVDCPGLEFQNEFLSTGGSVDGFDGVELELAGMPRYLNMRAESIYGGSSEVQREIIAKAVLGLR